MSDEVIASMQARVAQCRRLADSVNDAQATESLLRMAREIEADLRQLKANDAVPEGAGGGQ